MSDGRFRVRVIRAGLSLNRTFYPDATLRAAVPLFEGARVFVKSDQEHLAGTGKDVRNLIGGLSRPEFVPGDLPNTGELIADLRLIDPDNGVGRLVGKAMERGLQDLFGLSIAVEGTASTDARGTRIAESFGKVHSVDLIVEPGAGGQFIQFIEAVAVSNQGTTVNREQIIALIKTADPKALEGKDEAALSLEELTSILTAAIKPAGSSAQTETMAEAVGRRVSMCNRIAVLPTMPAAAKARLRGEVEAGAILTDAGLTQRISEELHYLAEATGDRWPTRSGGADDGSRFTVGDGPREKGAAMLDAFFDPAHKDHRHARSFKECYVEITGDKHLTGRRPQNARFSEALDSASFANALGNSITRRVLTMYEKRDHYDVWRDMVNIVPVNDFRTQERVRWGGYGNLPAVAEKAPYQPLASPTDEKATYAISKRGGTETVTLEMITNDDVGAIQRIPVNLATAAKRTLSEFVLSIPQDNAAIYDGKALFHTDHGNLGAAALSVDGVKGARLAVRNQKEKDNNKKLALVARYLWVPDELESTAYDLFVRGTNNDPTYVQSLAWKVRPVWCWTDANDWMVSVDPMEAPAIEVGFLGGREEPEIFVQDNPSVGSFFTNDQIVYKVRHIFGAVATDFRPFYKSVVA